MKKIALFVVATASTLVSACLEPQPRAVRPSLDPVEEQKPAPAPRPAPQEEPIDKDGNEPPAPQPPAPQPPAPIPSATCPSDSTCKTFTSKEIALCKLYGGGNSVCDGKQWSTEFYKSITNAIAIGKSACTISSSDVNLRNSPSLASSAIIEPLAQGSIVEKLADSAAECNSTTKKTFFSVRWGSKSGYICSSGLTCY
jgi:hypothetical protein